MLVGLLALGMWEPSVQLDMQCGNVYGPQTEVVTSPNWPSQYNHFINCTIRFRPGRSTIVSLVFTSLHLEGCHDRIEVHVFNLDGGVKSVGVKLCDNGTVSTTSPLRLGIPVTEGQDVGLRFVSDNSAISQGFRFIYYTSGDGLPPVSMTEAAPSSTDLRSCLNGGTSHDGVCSCPPGFSGSTCEKACGPDHFGENCEETCTEKVGGCTSKLFCRDSLEDLIARGPTQTRKQCFCASGLRGEMCNQSCASGSYGSGCTERCGLCKYKSSCDPYTGHCEHGCQPGYHPPYCQQGLTHLLDGLDNLSTTETSISGTILVSSANVAGDGPISTYQLQYKSSEGSWTAGAFGVTKACEDAPCSFTVDGLRPDTQLAVRVLLFNDNMEAFENVPYLTTRTRGQRQVSGVMVTNVTAGSLRVSWTSPVDNGLFSVVYECDSMLACPEMRCDYSNGMLFESGKSVLLEGLLPFTRYTITVAFNDESEVTTTTTLAAVPDAEVSELRARHLTNTTAVVRWSGTDSCVQLNGPGTKYRWAVYSRSQEYDPSNYSAVPPSQRPLREGTTNSKVVVLRDLQPLTNYVFQVNIVNALGNNDERWTTLNFKTLHTVPDAPRNPVVYRRNDSALWARWEEPLKPSGNILRYIFELQGGGESRRESVAPNFYCAAKPGFICHGVFGLRSHSDYVITIRAVNEHGDEPGEPATIHATTTIGVPGPPQDLRVKETRQRSVVLEWQLPDLLNSDLHSFDLVVSPVRGASSPPRRFELKVAEEKQWYTFTVDELQPGAVYEVEVRCGWKGDMVRAQFVTLSE